MLSFVWHFPSFFPKEGSQRGRKLLGEANMGVRRRVEPGVHRPPRLLLRRQQREVTTAGNGACLLLILSSLIALCCRPCELLVTVRHHYTGGQSCFAVGGTCMRSRRVLHVWSPRPCVLHVSTNLRPGGARAAPPHLQTRASTRPSFLHAVADMFCNNCIWFAAGSMAWVSICFVFFTQSLGLFVFFLLQTSTFKYIGTSWRAVDLHCMYVTLVTLSSHSFFPHSPIPVFSTCP